MKNTVKKEKHFLRDAAISFEQQHVFALQNSCFEVTVDSSHASAMPKITWESKQQNQLIVPIS